MRKTQILAVEHEQVERGPVPPVASSWASTASQSGVLLNCPPQPDVLERPTGLSGFENSVQRSFEQDAQEVCTQHMRINLVFRDNSPKISNQYRRAAQRFGEFAR